MSSPRNTVKDPVAKRDSKPLSYIVDNFRITYDNPETKKQTSWFKGEELIDDETILPHSEIKILIEQGCLILKVD